ncbi:hypothetical protein MY10362_006473 [Beauveria mimosiformis]
MSGYHPDQGATPPAPPPKPGSHETSRMATPSGAGSSSSVPPPPPPPPGYGNYGANEPSQLQHVQAADAEAGVQQQQLDLPRPMPDPGEGWLPEMLQDKSIQDLAAILANPALLQALTHAPTAAHPSLTASHVALTSALSSNAALGAQLSGMGARLAGARSATQAQLLSAHALERQWRQRQSDMDHALAPFSPAALYQALAHGVQEQAQVCQAMEDSFLEGGGGGRGEGARGGGGGGGGVGGGGELLTEREVAEWVKGYREAKVLYYQRQERKERWDEGRVGGWR